MDLENNIKKRRIITGILLLLVGSLIYLFFRYFSNLLPVIKPFFIGIVIAYILLPIISALENRKIPKWVALTLTYIFLLSVIGVSLYIIIPGIYNNINDLILRINNYSQRYNNFFLNVYNIIKSSKLPLEVKNIISNQFTTMVSTIRDIVIDVLKNSFSMVSGIFSFILNLILGLFISFYLLRDRQSIKNSFLLMIPHKYRNPVLSSFEEINKVLISFIQGQLTVALIVGILEMIGLSIVGIKYSFLLGTIGGLSNMIPYFGPFIGVVPSIIVALFQAPLKILWVILVFAIVQQIDNSMITPNIIGNRIGIHPVMVILVILLGGTLGGILGMILAVPIYAIIKIIIKRIITLVS